MKAAANDFMSMFDVNMNRMMEMNEHLRYLKVHGFTSEIDDMEFFRVAFNNTDSVPMEKVVDMWLHFGTDLTTNAENDAIDQAMKTVSHEEL